jgi:hypothetical protein
MHRNADGYTGERQKEKQDAPAPKHILPLSQELKAILCSLVSHFELIQAQDLPEETSAITMKPVGGITVRIRKLDPADSIKTTA